MFFQKKARQTGKATFEIENLLHDVLNQYLKLSPGNVIYTTIATAVGKLTVSGDSLLIVSA